MRIHELRDLVADAIERHARKPENLPGLLVTSPRQPRFVGGPRPREVSRNGDTRVWMWTVAQCKRLLPILEAAVVEHDAAHTFELPDIPSPDPRGDAR